MDITALAKHMSNHNTPFSKGSIKGIIEDMVECVRELILDGWIVDLGDMGTFNVSLKSTGVAESVKDEDTGKKPVFTAADINGVYCKYTAGKAFDEMISDCEFNEVESLDKQAEHLKAKKLQLEAGTWKPKDESTGGSQFDGSNEHE